MYNSPPMLTVANGSQHVQDIYPDLEQKITITNTNTTAFALQDGLAFMTLAAQAIAQDEFSKCFVQKPRNGIIKTIALGPANVLGSIIRYAILFPYRLFLLLVATLLFFMVLPIVLFTNNDALQRWLFRMYCGAFLKSWGSRIRYHGKKPDPNVPHLFVSNHTSVIDYLVLSAHKFPHATVAQKHGGVIGYFEHSILTLNGSLMFNRNEKGDRAVLSQKMRKHVHDLTRSPILIFPEGTCVNNEYTVLFHKGAFEMDCLVCPVAIKYDKSFADAYWHSKNTSFTKHLFYLMTRWALVADVWYLPPRARRPGQSSVEFANEVKAEISKKANLRNLSMDGYFKNFAPAEHKRQRMRENPQTRYGSIITNRLKKQSLNNSHKRHNSVVGFSTVPDAESNCQDFLLQQAELVGVSTAQGTSLRNRILVFLEDKGRTADMVHLISDRKHNVVETWKKFTKMRDMDDYSQRRIEYSSWRQWFKQRIEFQLIKEEEEKKRNLELNFDSVFYRLFSNRGESTPRLRRIQSNGSIPEGNEIYSQRNFK